MDAPGHKNPATPRKLLPENVRELDEYLDNVPARQRRSTREAVKMLMPKIIELQEKDYSIADIAVMIQEKGFDLSVNTFRAYVGIEGRKGERVADIADVPTKQAMLSTAGKPRSHLGDGNKKSNPERSRRKSSGNNASAPGSSPHENAETRGADTQLGKFEPRRDREDI